MDNLLLGVIYFATAKLGLLLAVPHPNVTPILPAAGIALAAVLGYGYRLLPGAAFGAFLVNATTAVPLGVAAGITAGNTLETFLGVFLLRHVVDFRLSLTRVKDILGLFGLAAFGATAVAATLGVLSLWAGGALSDTVVWWAWVTWWAGDALGIIIVTPLILVFARGEQPSLPSRWFGEGVLLLCALVAINLIVFRGALLPAESNYPLIYLSITIMVWVALRMNQRIAVTAVFVVAALAIWSTAYGIGPFADGAPAARFLLLDGFLGTLAFMTLSLSTVASQRARLWEAGRASDELKSRLIDGTPDCIKLLDAEGRLLSMNAGGMASFEIDDLNPLLKTSWIDFWGGEHREAARAAIATANSGQVSRFAGYCPTTVTSTPKWWDNLVSPIFDAQGQIEQLLVISRDVTEHKQANDALRSSDMQKRAILESALECIISIDREGRFIEFNPAAEKTFGYRRDQLIGKPLADYIIPPRLRELHARGLKYYLATGRGAALSKRMELTALRANGSEFTVEMTIEPIALNGQPLMFTAFLRDVSERKAAEEALRRSEQRYRSLVTATTSIVWTAAADGEIVDDMSSWEAFTGQTPDAYKGWGWLDAVHPDDRENTVKMWRRTLRTKQAGEIEERLRHRDGRYRHMLSRGVPICAPDGTLNEWVGTCTDITARKQAEQDLVHMANHDPLTGLPNRTLLMDRLGQALFRGLRYKEEVAVLFVDLDGFRRVNDTLGHNTGDLLLKTIAQRLTDCVRASDTVARFGGDEFVVMLVGFACMRDVNRIAEQIVRTLSKSMHPNGHEPFVTASIGISVYPRDGDDPHTLLKSADTAMYLAKHGGNRYRHFSTSLGAKTSRRLDLEQALRRALARDEFVLHYQPQIDLTSGRIDAVEALLRWRRPGRDELVPPLEFVPVAEACGLIVPIGEWALRAACEQSRAWRDQNLPPVRFAVNVSARQFRQQNMQKVIDRILRETGVDHHCLELELTESILQSKEAERTIVALEKTGIRFAIDDFGTGYSALSYLKRFPVYKLKIDRSFSHGIPAHQDNVAISTAIIALAHTLKLKVTAEGVETAEQLAFLRELHCDGAQGYLLGRPLPAEDLAERLADNGRYGLIQLDTPFEKEGRGDFRS